MRCPNCGGYQYRRNAEEEKIYKIPEENLARLRAELDKLNARAAKLGCEPCVMRIHMFQIVERHHEGQTWTTRIAHVSITGEPPSLAGWQLIAVITPQESGENLIKCVPSYTCPAEYRAADPSWCDHCKTRRYRRDVFIVRHQDGTHKQVGRQCLADFLGHKDPKSLVASAEILWTVDDLLSDSQEEGWGQGYSPTTYDLDTFVAAAACCIRRLGWVSRSRATDEKPATSQCILSLLDLPFDAKAALARQKWIDHNQLYVSENDIELAKKAIEWATNIPADTSDDYLYNLGVATRLGFVRGGFRDSTVGLIASLISAYNRAVRFQEDKTQRAQIKQQSQYVGEIGAKQGFPQLRVTFIRSFPGQYGVKTLIKFLDPQNNIIIWWASGEVPDWINTAFETSTPLDITATIKAHEVYEGANQTTVLRAKPGLPIEKKIRIKKEVGEDEKEGEKEGGGQRKCGICKQPGHNARTCPNKSKPHYRKNIDEEMRRLERSAITGDSNSFQRWIQARIRAGLAKIITQHGESGTIHYVVDLEAPEEEQPAIIASWSSRAGDIRSKH